MIIQTLSVNIEFSKEIKDKLIISIRTYNDLEGLTTMDTNICSLYVKLQIC